MENAPLPLQLVICAWDESPYVSDDAPFSRTGHSFTLHDNPEEARTRAIFETRECLRPSQAAVRRRCAVLAVMVPARVISIDGWAHRWVSDRLPELGRRAGVACPEADPRVVIEMAFAHLQTGEPHEFSFLMAACATSNAWGASGAMDLLAGMATMPAGGLPGLRMVLDTALEAAEKAADEAAEERMRLS